MNRVDRFGPQVDDILANFLENEALPGTDVETSQFWQGVFGFDSQSRP